MYLFNCKIDEGHLKLNSAAGVTYYPTVIYIETGPYHDNSIVPNSKNKKPMTALLQHTAIFRGDWNYSGALVDWLNAMKGLRLWHKFS